MILPDRLIPQQSERWAMYRLVCPIVDASRARTGLHPYFEYSRPVAPNVIAKVDIALLDGDDPVWYIEAKKYTRRIHPDMVRGYLHAR